MKDTIKDIFTIAIGAVGLLIVIALTTAVNLAAIWGLVKLVKWAWVG